MRLFHPFSAFTPLLAIGLVGVAVTSSATAQHPVNHTPQLQQMAQASSIEGSWRLVNMTEPGSPMPMVLPKTPKVTADFADGRVSGSGGCNRFNGGFESKGDQLTVGPLASTFMACEPPIMGMESKYLKALQAAQRYEVSSTGLQIFYQTEAGTGVLRFTAEGVKALW